MTWAQMKCDPAETERRQGVAIRLNKLWDAMQNADSVTRRKIERKIGAIRREEAEWLKPAAYFLYN